MDQQFKHGMLPKTTHDEEARQNFIMSLEAYIGHQIAPGLRQVYEQQIRPSFEQEYQRPPKDRYEVRAWMQSNRYYRWWSALRRTTQEAMWETVKGSVKRQLTALAAQAKKVDQRLGSLTLRPNFVVPAYQTAVDIHCMPGGYHSDLAVDDVTAGAIYDRGVYLYFQGQMGPLNDGLGKALIDNYLKPTYPTWKPRRILDLGCSVGHSTLPYVDAYPEAEVYAIDIGAAMLRYAHARAETLGKRVHFSQQNAERTNFEEGYFDLIVSHIFLHELPLFAIRKVMQECKRLLTPGGCMVHLEAHLFRHMDPFRAFLYDWETANNNEPFWSAMRDLDLKEIAAAAGFPSEQIMETFIPAELQSAHPSLQSRGQGFEARHTWFVLAAHS
ncbi:class I SAM-dependent methyltransferase [Anthocerotibacter panamensis]|uniref:class I SAM-dependent methyltransferase n=1 Tax=Anthocerotibacter panamensis TaxID=2857077 RepID=UPI001C401923|nr:class I SAM-dependent methyltransferase [Anthocerotibacter panamensis]